MLSFYLRLLDANALPSVLEIAQDSFEAKVTKDLSIPHASLLAFYKSQTFLRPGYSLNQEKGLILFPTPILQDD